MVAELGEIPAAAAEDSDFRAGKAGFGDERVEFAVHGLDEGGFAAAVGAEDGDVFAGVDGEVDVVEDDVVAAGYVDVGQMQERWHSSLGYRTRLALAVYAANAALRGWARIKAKGGRG